MSRYENLSDEGEVDHAFFDSDVDKVAKKVQSNVSETVKQKGLGAKDDKLKNGLKLKTVQEPQNSSSSDEERDEHEKPQTHALRDRQRTATTSGLSAAVPRSESALSSGMNSSQSLKIHTTIPTGIPTIRCEYEDSYYTDTEDSSDEGKARKCRPKSSKQPGSFKKNSVKKNAHIISSSSSSDAEDSDSDSCKSEPIYSNTKMSASASGSTFFPDQSPKSVKKTSKGNKKNQAYHDESEDTVTDVTPLSTPDMSPIQSFDLAANNEMKNKIKKRQENVSQEIYDPETENKYNQKALHDAMDLNQLLKAFMDIDKKEPRNMVLDHPATPCSSVLNYTFTNEVRHIDRENQRLLKELSRQATKPRSKSITPKKAAGPAPKLYHTTINRHREQRRIERDNLALLKRLESIKPTVGMKCSEQLMDYQRQVGYMNTGSTSPRPAKSSASRHSPSQGFSRASSAGSRRSERPLSTSSSAASLRPTKSNSARAAWM